MGSYYEIAITGPAKALRKVKLDKLPDFDLMDGYGWEAQPNAEDPARLVLVGNSKWSIEGGSEWAAKFTAKRPQLRVRIRQEWDNRDADEPGIEDDVFEKGAWIRAESKVNGEVPVDLALMLDRATALLDVYENAYPSQDEAVLAEVRATGSIIEAFRELIEGLR